MPVPYKKIPYKNTSLRESNLSTFHVLKSQNINDPTCISNHFDRNRKRNRLANFDYSSSRAYFVTICTANREHFFGEIRENKMILNDCGEITQKCWQEIPVHFLNVKLDEFIVMPNHTHGIIRIGNPIDDIFIQSKKKISKKSNLSVIVGSFKSATSKEVHRKIRLNRKKWGGFLTKNYEFSSK